MAPLSRTSSAVSFASWKSEATDVSESGEGLEDYHEDYEYEDYEDEGHDETESQHEDDGTSQVDDTPSLQTGGCELATATDGDARPAGLNLFARMGIPRPASIPEDTHSDGCAQSTVLDCDMEEDDDDDDEYYEDEDTEMDDDDDDDYDTDADMEEYDEEDEERTPRALPADLPNVEEEEPPSSSRDEHWGYVTGSSHDRHDSFNSSVTAVNGRNLRSNTSARKPLGAQDSLMSIDTIIFDTSSYDHEPSLVATLQPTGSSKLKPCKLYIGKEWSFGRATDNTFILSETYISKYHCEIRMTDDGIFKIHFTGAKNDIFIRQPSSKWVPLRRDDYPLGYEIQDGDHVSFKPGCLLDHKHTPVCLQDFAGHDYRFDIHLRTQPEFVFK